MTDHGKQLVLRRIERATTLVQLRQIWEDDLGETYKTPEILAEFVKRKEELE